MKAKKLVAISMISLGFIVVNFFIWSPNIPMPIKMQKQVMSVLYSDEDYAESAARSCAALLKNPSSYGFRNQEDVVSWLKSTAWKTDGSRKVYIEPELLGDIGWPTVVNSVKITLVYKRDNSRITHHYNIHSSFSKV